MDVVLPGKEQALPDRELAEAFLFFTGELEDIAKTSTAEKIA